MEKYFIVYTVDYKNYLNVMAMAVRYIGIPNIMETILSNEYLK